MLVNYIIASFLLLISVLIIVDAPKTETNALTFTIYIVGGAVCLVIAFSSRCIIKAITKSQTTETGE